jgi:hypothetical protein
MTSTVDVLVPVHSPQRPIARLASTVLRTSTPIRLVVVAHDVDGGLIEAALGEHSTDPRVLVLPFSDGVRSPAGPLQHALQRLESPFFMKIDSDDYLSHGAIESWLATQRRFGADIVMPTMTMAGTPRHFPTPPQRPFRRRLDPVRDRLAYRTSTMGLIRSELAATAMPQPGLETAEDLAPGLRLWFSGASIVSGDARHPYVVSPDATDRVTLEPRPIADELGFVAPLVLEPFWSGLPTDARVGIVAKLFRVQVVGALAKRGDRPLAASELEFVSAAVASLVALAPTVQRVLSREDAALLHALQQQTTEPADILRLSARSARHLTPGGLATTALADNARRDAPIRYLAASVLARYRR